MSGDVPEQLRFDTEVLPPNERLEAYRAIYGIGAEIAATGPVPRATFTGWRLDRAILYDRRLNDVSHRRTASALPRYDLSHWTVTLVIDGRLEFDLGDGPRRIRPGELMLMNTNKPSRNDAREAHLATLSIAQDRLDEMLGGLGGLHGVVVATADARLYASFVRALLATLPELPASALPATTAALGQLIRATLEVHGRSARLTPATTQETRLGQLRGLIDARLADPAFTPAAVADVTGLSRATLYRLLHPYGGLAAFIQQRRLEHLRRYLSDRTDQRSFATLAEAAGFRDQGQANRAFLTRFGIRPGAYRDAILQEEPNEQFRAWQRELR